MKTNGEIKFQTDHNKECFKVNILIDTGASHCFVNPKIFSHSIRMQIDAFKKNHVENNLELKKFTGSIETINSSQRLNCIAVSLLVRIGKWKGEQEFIVSDEIEYEECVLGRNFLKKNNVKLDYGNEKLTIGRMKPLDFDTIYLLILENYFFSYLKYLFNKKLINIKRF
jgi:predicted aspartyl protease